MDTKDISGNDLNNPYTEPEAPRMGRRRPHVPSSKPTMSKNHHTNQADNQSFPLFTSGDLVSVYVGDQTSASASRPVKRPLSPPRDSVNNLFAILFQSSGTHGISGLFAPLANIANEVLASFPGHSPRDSVGRSRFRAAWERDSRLRAPCSSCAFSIRQATWPGSAFGVSFMPFDEDRPCRSPSPLHITLSPMQP